LYLSGEPLCLAATLKSLDLSQRGLFSAQLVRKLLVAGNVIGPVSSAPASSLLTQGFLQASDRPAASGKRDVGDFPGPSCKQPLKIAGALAGVSRGCEAGAGLSRDLTAVLNGWGGDKRSFAVFHGAMIAPPQRPGKMQGEVLESMVNAQMTSRVCQRPLRNRWHLAAIWRGLPYLPLIAQAERVRSHASDAGRFIRDRTH
jgi:hypothetical protein